MLGNRIARHSTIRKMILAATCLGVMAALAGCHSGKDPGPEVLTKKYPGAPPAKTKTP